MRRLTTLLVFTMLLGGFGLSHIAHAAPITLTVNTTADSVDNFPGNGLCADASNRCSLRAAVMEASARNDGSTITVPVGTYTLTLASGVDDASFGDLDIMGALTLQGADETKTIIRQIASGQRVLMVAESVGTVSISGLTLTGGTHPPIADGNTGGGLRIRPNNIVHVSNLIIRENQSWFGGGIGCINSTLTVSDSRIEGNFANYEAGGIYSVLCSVTLNRIIVRSNSTYERAGGILAENNNSFSLTDSVIEGNTSQDLGGGLMVLDSPFTVERVEFMRNSAHDGAGVLIRGANAVGDIRESYFHDNRASGNGGGLQATEGNLTISRSSFVQNYAVQGSGAYVIGIFQLENSTFSENMALLRGSLYVDSASAILSHITITGGSALYEGGLTLYGSPTLNNSIVANSFSPIGYGDCGGSFISSGRNLIHAVGGCDSSITANEIIDTDPALDLISLNVTVGEVNPANIIALPSLGLSGVSPVNNVGVSDCLSIDQHGTPRTLTGCDLGAVESPDGMTSRQIVRNGSFEDMLGAPWKSVSATKFTRACENSNTGKYPAYLGNCALSSNKGTGRYDQSLLAVDLPDAGDSVILQVASRVNMGVPTGKLVLLKLTGAEQNLTLVLNYVPTMGYQVISTQACIPFDAVKGKLSLYAAAGSKVEVDDVAVFVQTGTSCAVRGTSNLRDGALALPPVTIPDGFRGGN